MQRVLVRVGQYYDESGAYLQDNWLLYVCFLPLLLLFMMALFAVPWLRLRRDQMILYIPVISGLMKTIYTSRFASAFSVLYGSGTGILECMDITGHVMGNTWIEKKLIEAAVGLQKGESLSQALSRQRIFHPVFFPWCVTTEKRN